MLLPVDVFEIATVIKAASKAAKAAKSAKVAEIVHAQSKTGKALAKFNTAQGEIENTK